MVKINKNSHFLVTIFDIIKKEIKYIIINNEILNNKFKFKLTKLK